MPSFCWLCIYVVTGSFYLNLLTCKVAAPFRPFVCFDILLVYFPWHASHLIWQLFLFFRGLLFCALSGMTDIKVLNNQLTHWISRMEVSHSSGAGARSLWVGPPIIVRLWGGLELGGGFLWEGLRWPEQCATPQLVIIYLRVCKDFDILMTSTAYQCVPAKPTCLSVCMWEKGGAVYTHFCWRDWTLLCLLIVVSSPAPGWIPNGEETYLLYYGEGDLWDVVFSF